MLNDIELGIIKETEQELIFFFEKTLESNNLFYQLTFIKYNKDGSTLKYDSKPFRATASDFKNTLFKEKAVLKNLEYQENVYIRLTDKSKYSKLIWLDDIKLENIGELKDYMTLIETSPNNYQAFIVLEKSLSIKDLQKIKASLIHKFGADTNASSYIQPMRLPFVYSYKHQEPFLVTVKQYATKQLNPALIQPETHTNTSKLEKYIQQLSHIQDKDFKTDCEFYKKLVETIVDKKKDMNSVDFAIATRFANRNLSELRKLLMCRELLDGKHKYEDYTLRTVLKAVIYAKVKDYGKMKKLFEKNRKTTVIETAFAVLEQIAPERIKEL